MSDRLRYVCLIYDDEGKLAALPAAEGPALTAACAAVDAALEASGHLVLGHALKPPAQAKAVRVRKRRKMVTDGPFAETKEQMVGFILIDAADMAEAVEIASRSPLAALARIEVRQAFDIRWPDERVPGRTVG